MYDNHQNNIEEAIIMCTSVTFLSTTGDHFLARTMDFAFELDGRPVVIPRHQTFTNDPEDSYTTTYSFVGAGRNFGHYILVDGVNEHGLSAAALYFSGEASYAPAPVDGKVNLAPHEVLNWLLGNNTDCADLGSKIDTLNIFNKSNRLLKLVVPLHWIIADKTGHTYVLEMQADGLHYLENPVGVMTNTPDFNWHLKNLHNYTNLQPGPHPDRQFDQMPVSAYGPGSGMLGTPGDYTSVSRFVRTAFIRQYTQAESTENTVNVLSHILNSVEIPKGVKLKDDGSSDYTQYRGYMSMADSTYYMQPYQDQTISRVRLTADLMNLKEPKEFPLHDQQQVVDLV
ncbi:Choloylglycine hydrolase [Secundilactobacillus odoratitofui DSM 19909 = JCM 15043]|uniref:Choloylglycine hydrolase n=2 Tax=Secundilactobacillus odoratitofui TaxID=480930 RepID=A0A0R1M0Z3_9LACO|nr:Choloylglycine hydrolase [Secundilactobacillus odoratitofui DSM 19909 = JCM 15043]